MNFREIGFIIMIKLVFLFSERSRKEGISRLRLKMADMKNKKEGTLWHWSR